MFSQMLIANPLGPKAPVRALVQRGFTLVELMVTVAILAVLASLAAPSFSSMIDNYRVRLAIEEMTNAFFLARSEAARPRPNNSRVLMRKACGTGTNQEWKCGWEIFVDTDGNDVRNGPDELLKVFPEFSGVDINNLGNSAFIVWNRWGEPQSLGAASFSFVPTAAGVSSPHATVLCRSAGGRIRTIKGAVTCP